MIGAFEFRRPSLFVIRESQPQRGHAQAVEDAARLDVAVWLRVPLWQYEDCGAWFSFTLAPGPKQPRSSDIVFGRRSRDRAGPGQSIAAEMVVRDGRRREKLFATRHHEIRVVAENLKARTQRHVMTCYFTMVAVDEFMKPCAVQPLVLRTEEDKRWCKEAERRKAIRIGSV